MGGKREDIACSSDVEDAEDNDSIKEVDNAPKIFSQKRLDANISSRIGKHLTQKLEVPTGMNQVICVENCDSGSCCKDGKKN